MIVDVINHNAKGFYEQFGFARLSDGSPRLFLPMRGQYEELGNILIIKLMS